MLHEGPWTFVILIRCWAKRENSSSWSQRGQQGVSASIQEVWAAFWVLLGEAVHTRSLLTYSQPPKNEPWAWNPSLLRAKESSQPHRPSWASHLGWEYLFLCQNPCNSEPLLCFSRWVIWRLLNLPTIGAPCWEGTGSFCAAQEWRMGQLTCSGCQEEPTGHRAPRPWLKLILF